MVSTSSWIVAIVVALLLFGAVIVTLGYLFGWENFWNVLQASLVSIIGIIFSGFLIFIGMMVAPYNPKVGRWIAYGGVVGLMFLLMVIEVFIIKKASDDIKFINDNTDFWGDCGTNPPKSWHSYLACALTGHQPINSGTSNVWNAFGIFGFVIFGLTIPLAILTSLLIDIVESSGVVQSPTYQKFIGFGLGFMAYRGFIVTRLIYILDIGTTGVAVIALNFIFLGGVLAYVKRAFKQWQEIEHEMDIATANSQFRKIVIETLKNANSVESLRNAFNDERFYGALKYLLGEIEAKKLQADALNAQTKSDAERVKRDISSRTARET
ncbi:MAG: hypothetical protein QXM68_01740 [Candidatus Aenigmatarchaeota archaeon]|nr:hypothetical protein [Candidatus Aenigmarchaeota archaeon]